LAWSEGGDNGPEKANLKTEVPTEDQVVKPSIFRVTCDGDKYWTNPAWIDDPGDPDGFLFREECHRTEGPAWIEVLGGRLLRYDWNIRVPEVVTTQLLIE
jgi:hypothetical protein